MSEQFEVIGKRIPHLDSVPKVIGAAKYIRDMVLPGMLYGKFLRSPHAHARVVSIDTSQAEKLPGVKAVLTAGNTPSVDSPYSDRRIFRTGIRLRHLPVMPEDILKGAKAA
ncbi:MAG: hypothetical protein HY530_02295 [Chloroflexi bacterium]|nr:hypothetical protein [Chloroflexota bacterium]